MKSVFGLFSAKFAKSHAVSGFLLADLFGFLPSFRYLFLAAYAQSERKTSFVLLASSSEKQHARFRYVLLVLWFSSFKRNLLSHVPLHLLLALMNTITLLNFFKHFGCTLYTIGTNHLRKKRLLKNKIETVTCVFHTLRTVFYFWFIYHFRHSLLRIRNLNLRKIS